MDQKIVTVAELTRQIKSLLEQSFPRLWVEGELSNFKHHSSGHLYFTLKDSQSQISCAMWRFRASSLLFRPENGMKVLVEGDVQVYERGGNYQLIANQMQPAGVGSLQLAFEQLKRKLHAEGLFEDHHKKRIPPYPGTVGVITSATGAALRDIISVSRRRSPSTALILYPARVQGEGAAEEITAAIRAMNEHGEADVLIVGRGGGSLEDLWAFNEETVARAIFNSRIPVISAVGHEIDFTIADFVADRRAPTPSAAAEMAIPSTQEMMGQLNYFREKFLGEARKNIEQHRQALEGIKNSYGFRLPQDSVSQYGQRLDELSKAITAQTSHRIALYKSKLEAIRQAVVAAHPEKILKRGYSIVYSGENPVQSVHDVSKGDDISITLENGRMAAKVTDIEESSDE